MNLVVYDVIPSKLEEVVNSGAKKAASSKEVAASATLIFTMLPNSPEVKESRMGENGVLEVQNPVQFLLEYELNRTIGLPRKFVKHAQIKAFA
jgi:2-hydroxy-3-oxopropionate reductase